MEKWQKAASPVSVFYSYAPEDEKLQRRLEKHLAALRRQERISDWHNHKIVAGSERAESINSHLESAALILLLISPDFMASDYCYGVEMQRALERHRAGLARVIPILLRPVDWQSAPFAPLQVLPRNGRAVVQWDNRDEALLTIVQGIREAIDAMEVTEVGRSEQFAAQKPVQDQNRQRFLQRVRTTWIAGVLEHSLFNTTLMTLGLHELPDAVVNPWQLLVQETQQAPRLLPPDTHITEVYDDASGELLILGEPGAGKTTLLLELARDLLTRAEYNADFPLPAIFNLSSWAEKRQPIATWLVEELHDRYLVPRKLGRLWVASDQLLPLLDGLDEVVPLQRNACIEAINFYHREHELVPLVVCSRHAEYMQQAERITLQRSVRVKTLTMQQIDAYLASAGEQVAAVSTTLHKDAELQELASTPLMLNILMLTYQSKTLDELAPMQSPELLRKQLFTQYIARMLQRRGLETRYPPHYIIICLVNLARQMKRHEQTVFYIERMQMNWLATSRLKRYFRIGTALICAFAGMLIGLLAIWLTVKPLSLLAVLIGSGGFSLAIGLWGGVQQEIRPSETFIWSWKIMLHRWFNIPLLMFFCGLIGGVGINHGKNMLVSTLIGGSFGVLFSIIFNVVLEGEANSMPDTRHIITSNQEIKKSAYYSLMMIIISAVFVLLFIPFSKLGIILAAALGLVGALGFGGLACIQHIVLRFLLWRSRQLPWNLPRFLDYAAERILLRKVGGGYIFVHRLLLDYFAALDEDEIL